MLSVSLNKTFPSLFVDGGDEGVAEGQPSLRDEMLKMPDCEKQPNSQWVCVRVYRITYYLNVSMWQNFHLYIWLSFRLKKKCS